MAYSNRSVALRSSKALFKHRHGAAASPPLSGATALNRLHEESDMDVDRAKAEQLRAGMAGEGAMTSIVEVAYDSTKGTAEKVKDTTIAEANENVVDTIEYRSMGDMGNYQNILL
ncbi:uncharacterized protein LOC120087104 [Benincasa hispida]|uniref:uncharacterized protein LOC120087104 n=1 Tax=Benincasa hispida TaxID=102211 RepID=UPI0018FF79C6|nr:uncharacterized protein LOC120087104 [Benincasa hispida]